MRVRFLTMAIASLAASMLVAAGCAKNDVSLPIAKGKVNQTSNKRPAKDELKEEPTGEELEKLITKHALEDIKYWSAQNPDDYSKGFIGSALSSLQNTYKKDLEAGKIKVRVHKDVDLKITGMQFGTPKGTYKFRDESYYIDAKTKKPISQAESVQKEWKLAFRKDKDGTWKISLVMGVFKAPPEMEEAKKARSAPSETKQ